MSRAGTTYFIICAVSFMCVTAKNSTCTKTSGDLNFLRCCQLRFINMTWINASAESPKVSLKFEAFDKNYTIVLKKIAFNRLLLHPEARLYRHSMASASISDLIVYYEGYGTNHKEHSHGFMMDDRFDGVVKTKDLTLFIEPFAKYHPSTTDKTHILYRLDDVIPQNISQQMAADEHDNGTHQSSSSARRLRKPSRQAPAFQSASRYCSVHVVVDAYFLRHMAAGNVQGALNEIVYHIQEASTLYTRTDFNGDGLPDAIGLYISNVTFIDKILGYDYLAPTHRKDPQEFLNIFSATQYPRACVALLFTYQDMPSTLGMAWVAKPSIASQHGIGSRKNHGFVTCSLDGSRVSKPGISITVGHEIGHSFGSMHDKTTRGTPCAPTNAEGGAYIMYPMVSTGAYPNNFKFSPCSKKFIDAVLEHRQNTALTSLGMSYCGNAIVEEGEECDCGTPASCDEVDGCCTPPGGNAGGDGGCRVRRSAGAQCSPRNMPCCTTGCLLVEMSSRTICGKATDCTHDTYCNGSTGYCPTLTAKPDGSFCNGMSQVCQDGRCSGSACSLQNLTQCACQSEADLCTICCRVGSGECTPDWMQPPLGREPIRLPAGSLCAGETGYCDEQHVCQVPGSGLPSGLIGAALSAAVQEWFSENWVYVVLSGITVSACIFVFYGACARRSPHWGEAYRSGAMCRVYFEAKRRLATLNALLKKFDLRCDAVCEGSRPYAGGLAKLALLFPTASAELLRHVAIHAFSERESVRRLLALGYPMPTDWSIRRTYGDRSKLSGTKKKSVSKGSSKSPSTGGQSNGRHDGDKDRGGDSIPRNADSRSRSSSAGRHQPHADRDEKYAKPARKPPRRRLSRRQP